MVCATIILILLVTGNIGLIAFWQRHVKFCLPGSVPLLFAYGIRHDFHYENMPIQMYRKFRLQKTENFQIKKNTDNFHISAQNIDSGCSFESPRRGGSNEYPQSMFLS